MRAGDWKLVLHQLKGKGRSELFNLADDPGEKKDLAMDRPEKVKELREMYNALARQAVAPKSRPKAAGFKSPKVWGEE